MVSTLIVDELLFLPLAMFSSDCVMQCFGSFLIHHAEENKAGCFAYCVNVCICSMRGFRMGGGGRRSPPPENHKNKAFQWRFACGSMMARL